MYSTLKNSLPQVNADLAVLTVEAHKNRSFPDKFAIIVPHEESKITCILFDKAGAYRVS